MITSRRADFDIPDDVAFLTAASYSPLPTAVQVSGHAGVKRKAAPWAIDRAFRETQNERARANAAVLINADADDVALVPSVSYGFATAAGILKLAPGSRVLVLADDHVSPVLAWDAPAAAAGAHVETVRVGADHDWTAAVREAIARPGAAPLAVASISMVHWSDGVVLDMAAIADDVRAVGASLAIDATQAIGVVDLDVRAVDPDFVMFPTYKWLLGPYGRAFLYAAKRHQTGVALEQTASGRRAVNSEALTYLADIDYVDTARRFDMGERDHFITMEMASVGMEYAREIGAQEIATYTGAMTDGIADALADHVAVTGPHRAPHILSLAVTPEDAKPICAALAEQNIHVSPRLGRVRVSPHVYNTDQDAHRFIDAFRTTVAKIKSHD